MSPPHMRAGIYRLQNSNFSTLASFTSDSLISIDKCCKSDQFYSVGNRKCVSQTFDTSLPNSHVRPDPLKFDVHYGFPCLYPDYRYFVRNSRIHNASQDGSVDLLSSDEETNFNLKRGQYCLDVDGETVDLNLLLISCDQLLPLMPTHLAYLIFYWVSLSLAFTTLSIFLAISELRSKVKDKCFICYLISYLLWMLIIGDVWGLKESSVLKNFNIDVAFGLDSIGGMVTLAWVNVMCIHLWRTVTSLNSIHPRCFYVYILYAWGLPLTCRILFHIDRLISGVDSFSYREANGGLFSNPLLLYWVNVCSLQLIMNFGLFVHVGFIIWRQNRKWNENKRGQNGIDDSVGMKHYWQHKTMFSQVLRLSIVMDFEWVYIFTTLCLRIEGASIVFSHLIFWVKLCPGYYIFIIHVCCNKQVISLMRKRLSKNMDEVTSPSTSFHHTFNSSDALNLTERLDKRGNNFVTNNL